jgi:hypothetical protein
MTLSAMVVGKVRMQVLKFEFERDETHSGDLSFQMALARDAVETVCLVMFTIKQVL